MPPGSTPAKEAGEDKPSKPKLEIVPSPPEKEEKKSSWADNLKPLSVKEAKDLALPLAKTLQTIGGYVDEVITFTNGEQAEAKIWRKITLDEWQIIADMLIEDAKKSGIIATAIRGTVSAYQRLQAGLIIGPRLWETYQFYADHGGFKLFPALGKSDKK